MSGDKDDFTDAQISTLVALNITASVFSFLGASFIVTNYCLFEDFRKNIAFKLILFVAIGDIINSVGNFMGSPQGIDGLCELQGFIIQFGDLVSFGWVAAIAFIIYRVITLEEAPTSEDVQRWYKRLHIGIWTLTTILSILPLTTNSYGPSGGLCWIQFDKEGKVWMWLCFYVPLWLCILFVAAVYARVWKRLTMRETAKPTNVSSHSNVTEEAMAMAARKGTGSEDKMPANRESLSDNLAVGGSSSDIAAAQKPSAINVTTGSENDVVNTSSGGGTLQRIKYYPFVLIGCYLFATIRRLMQLLHKDGEDAPFAVVAIQVFSSALLGTFNALLYGGTPAVRQKDAEWLRQKCGRGVGRVSPQGTELMADKNENIGVR